MSENGDCMSSCVMLFTLVAGQILVPDYAACLSVKAFLEFCGLDYKVELRTNAEHISPSGTCVSDGTLTLPGSMGPPYKISHNYIRVWVSFSSCYNIYCYGWIWLYKCSHINTLPLLDLLWGKVIIFITFLIDLIAGYWQRMEGTVFDKTK